MDNGGEGEGSEWCPGRGRVSGVRVAVATGCAKVALERAAIGRVGGGGHGSGKTYRGRGEDSGRSPGSDEECKEVERPGVLPQGAKVGESVWGMSLWGGGICVRASGIGGEGCEVRLRLLIN